MTKLPHTNREIRQFIRQKRRSLSVAEQSLASTKVKEILLSHKKIIQARNIAFFLSIDGELPTQPIIEALWQAGKSVYLPVIHPFSPRALLFFRYEPTTELITLPYQLKQPKLNITTLCPIEALDVILTPLVAFDKQGNRLGMGGGYYDKLLKNWQQSAFYPIGVAHDCQQVEQLTTAAWDVPLPEIITPSTHWQFKQ